jgi:hypothetical protein
MGVLRALGVLDFFPYYFASIVLKTIDAPFPQPRAKQVFDNCALMTFMKCRFTRNFFKQ